MADQDGMATELALERLRGSMEKSLAEIDGKLNLLIHDSQRLGIDVAAHDARISALEKRVWVASGGAALLGMLVPYMAQTLGQG